MTNVIYSTDKQWRVTSCDKNTVGLLLWPYLKNHIFLVPVNYVYRGRNNIEDINNSPQVLKILPMR
jgi:hypothetical protein